MSYYTTPTGRDARFILRDRNGKTLAESSGRKKGLYPLQLKRRPSGFDKGYPLYEVITVNGKTDIIEHRKMEPIFYVTDDPAVRNELLAEPKKK
jgi:hypothetical protein